MALDSFIRAKHGDALQASMPPPPAKQRPSREQIAQNAKLPTTGRLPPVAQKSIVLPSPADPHMVYDANTGTSRPKDSFDSSSVDYSSDSDTSTIGGRQSVIGIRQIQTQPVARSTTPTPAATINHQKTAVASVLPTSGQLTKSAQIPANPLLAYGGQAPRTGDIVQDIRNLQHEQRRLPQRVVQLPNNYDAATNQFLAAAAARGSQAPSNLTTPVRGARFAGVQLIDRDFNDGRASAILFDQNLSEHGMPHAQTAHRQLEFVEPVSPESGDSNTEMSSDPPDPINSDSREPATTNPPAPLRTPRKNQGKTFNEETTPRPRKRAQAVESLDYSRNELLSMTYDDLSREAFDHAASDSAKDSQVSIQHKLQHFATMSAEQQADMFANMPISEWEEAGDWFMDRFMEVMQKMKAARKEKRAISEKFEKELGERERAIEAATATVEEKLDSMKAQGQALLGSSRAGTPVRTAERREK